MADPLPPDGQITNPTRLTADVRADLDDTLNVVRQLIGAVVAESSEITTGALAPSAAWVMVDNEGSASADNLDTITATPYVDGALLELSPLTPGNTTTIRHDQGVGGIVLKDASNWDLTSSRWIIVRYDSSTSKWREVRRGYGVLDHAGFRAALGLGTAALLDDGNVDAATLGGVAASGYVQVGDPVGDADTVDGIQAAGFLQLALASLQQAAGIIQTNAGSFISNVNVGDECRFQLDIDGVQRGHILFHRNVGTDSYLTLRIYDDDGLTLLREFKFVADEAAPTYTDVPSATTKTFMMVEDFSAVLGSGFLTGSVSSTIGGSDPIDTIVLDQYYFGFTCHAENVAGSHRVWLGPELSATGTDADRTNPRLTILTDFSGGELIDWEASWYYHDVP